MSCGWAPLNSFAILYGCIHYDYVPLVSDHHCHQLQNTSRAINVHGGIEKMDPNVSIPDTWAENSTHNIQDSQGRVHGLGRLGGNLVNQMVLGQRVELGTWVEQVCGFLK